MSGRRFGRRVAITIARPVVGSFSNIQPNAIVVRDLRVTVAITKTLGKDPNTCIVQIYNLSPATRAELQRKPLQIRVEVGYEDVLETVFLGDLKDAPSKQEGADIVTKIQVTDGDRCMSTARVSSSYIGKVSTRQVVKDVAAEMGLVVPRIIDTDNRFLAASESGLVLSGMARHAMSRALACHGMVWSIQDGQLQILEETAGVRADQALVIQESTGMVGSPEFNAPAKPGATPNFTVSHLMYPSCKPGGKVLVLSDVFSGLARIEKVDHVGDIDGEEWLTKLECKRL